MTAANLQDMSILMTDATFANRVLSSLLIYCGTVSNETSNGAVHQVRKNFSANVMNNPNQYKSLFTNAVAVNQIVANEAVASTANASFTGAIATTVLTVTGSPTGNPIGIGQTVSGAGVATGTIITSLGTGVGGTGTYNLSGGAQTIIAEAMTTVSTPLNSVNINVPLQSSLTLDSDINNAVAAAFNTFISGI